MAAFIRLEDSPMFQKQVRSLEQTTDELRDRCQKLYKGSKKYAEVLGESCNGDIIFAESLEAFGGGLDDPVSVAIGGPIISKFHNALRELASYKEFLRSQVEHVLVDQLAHIVSVDLQDAKECRRRFDKATYAYEQARERFASLKKSTREEVAAEVEEDLHNSKSTFERSRFNLVNALMNIEAKKKYQFLESFSAIMDAHLRYFKLGYDLLSKIEPFIHEVLTYAQQSKEQSNVEQDKLAKRMQEFRTKAELDQLQSSSNTAASKGAIVMNGFDLSNYKSKEGTTAAKGEVQTVKQGYLMKKSSSLRADWKRRFFVLDSHGTLYYYREKGDKRGTSPSHHSINSVEQNSRVFGRFRGRQDRASSLTEESLGCQTIDLHTSIIKIDAEDPDLPLCFRIISPSKTYTLRAESEAERIEWMEKITDAIASLLNSHIQQLGENVDDINDSSGTSFSQHLDNNDTVTDNVRVNRADSVSRTLREIPGNNQCAECGAAEPNWASLNLGILMCIECSGIHRNLGVHISKVRSVTLDVKVWEPAVLGLFQTLGNQYCNSVWEELLLLEKDGKLEPDALPPAIAKPNPKDAVHQKEKYIQAKYVGKLLVHKLAGPGERSCSAAIGEAVRANNLREVYRIIVASDVNIVNTTYDELVDSKSYDELGLQKCIHDSEEKQFDPAACEMIKSSNNPGNCLRGCTLLHIACHNGNPVMLELLLQFGADINRCDFHGRTPLQHCISKGNNQLAKFLLRRGASASIKDAGGLTALERAMEMGAIKDEELFLLLTKNE